MARLFGTDGVRGKANVAPMDSDTVLRLGRAAAYVLRQSKGHHRILIGKDTRLSGYMLEQALASGITSMGVDVFICGPIPTPGVAYLTRSMRADAGVMISASHNSYEDNGIKFFGADGFKLADETEDQIEQLMAPGQLDQLRAVPELIGKAKRIEDAIGRYTVFLKNAFDRECTLEGMQIVLDTANGAAYRTAPNVFSELGADIFQIGNTPNGKNINLNCGSLHPEGLSAEVRSRGADVGIGFDGDADRIVMCDEKGNLFDGDQLLAIIAFDAHQRGTLRGEGVVGTVMSNLGLELALKERKLRLYRSDVGDRYVLQEMFRVGANFGGEPSGHLIGIDYNTTGDAILSALLVLNVVRRSGRPLSAFRSLLHLFPQKLINIKVTRRTPLNELAKVAKVQREVESELGNRGRVLLRYSGTEPKVRVMVECEDEVLCNSSAEKLVSILSEELGG